MPDRYLGLLLGRYRATRVLGTGSFSWVYEAVDTETGTPIALKVLRPEYAGQVEAEARFRREAQTAGRLRHPNIVMVRDVGQSGTASYVAMDLLPLSLARRLELVHRLPEPEVVRVGLDIASALAIAHAEGVVHRDIKPDNILLGENGEAIVGDFGLASALQGDPSLSASQQVMGTPHYFSPEQARGQPVDGRSDLYSLGVTLYRAATGRLPYEGDDWYSVARQHIESPVPSARALVPELTEGLDRILSRLLAKRPEQRFPSATSLIDALAQLPTAPERVERRAGSGSADATMITPAPLSAAVRARRSSWARRAGAMAALLTLAVVLFVVGERSRSGSLWGMLGGRTSPDTAPLITPVPPADSARLRDSLLASVSAFGFDDTSSTLLSPGSATPPTAPATSLEARRARIDLDTDADATVYVESRVVGTGPRVLDIPVGRSVLVRAAFPDAKPECATALLDSTVRMREGERRTLTLDVRPCGSVTFNVIPEIAEITLRPVAGGQTVTVRADVGAVLLPAGRYELTATAPGYFDYIGDFVDIPRSGVAPAKRIRMQQR